MACREYGEICNISSVGFFLLFLRRCHEFPIQSSNLSVRTGGVERAPTSDDRQIVLHYWSLGLISSALRKAWPGWSFTNLHGPLSPFSTAFGPDTAAEHWPPQRRHLHRASFRLCRGCRASCTAMWICFLGKGDRRHWNNRLGSRAPCTS